MIRNGSVWSEIATCANNVGSLTPGATSNQSCIITMPPTAGEYFFGMHIDTVPGESNTADNDSAPIKITVGAGRGRDYNGDGKGDLIWQSASNQTAIWQMKG